MIYIVAYFILSAFVWSMVVLDDRRGLERVIAAVVMTIAGPVAPLVAAAAFAWEWLESHAQAKTFWYFLFNRKRMIRSTEELDRMHYITKEYRATGSLHHRLWRLAERCYFIVNRYKPSDQ